MGLFEKIKGLFYDEEEIDVPEEQRKEEISIKSGNIAVMELNNEKRETVVETREMKQQLKINEQPKIDEIDEVVSERDLVSTTQNFKFPIIFEDEDIAQIEKKEPVKKKEENLEPKKSDTKYQKPVLDRKVVDEVIKKPKKFQPTPIISPIYGILDKNYDQKSSTKNSSTTYKKDNEMELNFDTIRQKAYGTLADDLENEMTKSEATIDAIENKIDNILEENNLLSDLEEDNNEINSSDDNLYNYDDFGVEYKIDDSTEKNQENKKAKKDKEVELTEDLFNLIDSMYDK